MNKLGIVVGVLFLGGLVLLANAYFIVRETERAVVVEFGRPVGDVRGPGLHLKIPFIQQAKYFDGRILDYDMQPTEVLTSDKKNMLVDSYFKWRIVDPLQFYRTVQSVQKGSQTLNDVVYSELREALGQHTLIEIVAKKRSEIMEQITEKASTLAAGYGVKLLDVRIKRTDLPAQNLQAIFERMRAERERQAKQYRSEGREEAAKIRSSADKDREIILAEARRESAVLRGQGEANATGIYAKALSKGPEFYAFQRSMQAYRKSLGENTRILLTPESEFLDFLN